MRRGESGEDSSATGTAVAEDGGTDRGTGGDQAHPPNRRHTPAKGKPTPKRRESSGAARGPAAPPPRTQREAAKRARGNKDQRRDAARERRARMDAGDERYVMPRDRGPVKAYVRDLVDSRRHVMGVFMPLVFVMFISLLLQNPAVQQVVSLLMTVILLVLVAEGVVLGRRVTRAVREKFPDATNSGLGLGWYATSRAMQLRKLRTPKPKVTPGAPV